MSANFVESEVDSFRVPHRLGQFVGVLTKLKAPYMLPDRSCRALERRSLEVLYATTGGLKSRGVVTRLFHLLVKRTELLFEDRADDNEIVHLLGEIVETIQRNTNDGSVSDG